MRAVVRWGWGRVPKRAIHQGLLLLNAWIFLNPGRKTYCRWRTRQSVLNMGLQTGQDSPQPLYKGVPKSQRSSEPAEHMLFFSLGLQHAAAFICELLSFLVFSRFEKNIIFRVVSYPSTTEIPNFYASLVHDQSFFS